MPKKSAPIKKRVLTEELRVTLGLSVEELNYEDLGPQIRKRMKVEDIRTLGELAVKTTNEILKWKAREELPQRINKALKPFGLSLNMEFVSPPEEVGKLSPVSNLMYPLNE